MLNQTGQNCFNIMKHNNKVISLHQQRCEENCPHASVCYHKNKDVRNIDVKIKRVDLLKSGYTVYESLCNSISKDNLQLLKKYKNYNITLSYNTIYDLLTGKSYKFLLQRKDQIQVTVYNRLQAIVLKEFQKIFLVKDKESFILYKSFLVDDDLKKDSFRV